MNANSNAANTENEAQTFSPIAPPLQTDLQTLDLPSAEDVDPEAALAEIQIIVEQLEKNRAARDCWESREMVGNQGDSAGNSLGNKWDAAGNPGKSQPNHADTGNTIPSPAPSPAPAPPRTNKSILLSLSPAERQFVHDLIDDLTLEQAKRRLAIPPPIGLGIVVSRSALGRFNSNRRMIDVIETSEVSQAESELILECTEEFNDDKFIKAARHLLKVRLMRASVSPVSQTAEIRSLFQILDRLRQTDLAERRLALAEQAARTD